MEKCQKVILPSSGESISVRPRLTNADVVALARNLFGLETSNPEEVKELNSYSDRNFYMKGRLMERGRSSDDSYARHSEFVLKISNSSESRNRQFFEILEDLVSLCNQQSIDTRFPVTIHPLNGEAIVLEEIPLEKGFVVQGGSLDDPNVRDNLKDILTVKEDLCLRERIYLIRHIVRLFVYVPGTVLTKDQVNAELAHDVGELVAHIRLAWQGYPHYAVMERPHLMWNLSRFYHTSSTLITCIRDSKSRDLVLKIVDSYKSYVLPRLRTIEQGYAHCDVNEHNIIVGCGDNERVQLLALIDFGDMNYSYPIFDLAIAMAYLGVLMPSQFVLITGSCLKGYHSVFPVPEAEFDLLFHLLLARLAQSLTIGEYQYNVVDPGNEYILVTAKHVRNILTVIDEIGREKVLSEWKRIIMN